MLFTLAVVLVVLWVIGLATATMLGGFLHLLLVLAVVLLLVRIIRAEGHSGHGHADGSGRRRGQNRKGLMSQGSKLGMLVLAVAVFASAIATGCASTALRTEASTSGIRAAEEVGAAQVPQASLHLQLAKEELEKAKKLASNGEKDQATSMLTRAEADAEVAVALSREDAEKSEAQAAIERVQQLRRENQ